MSTLQERIDMARLAQSGIMPKGSPSSILKQRLLEIQAQNEADRNAALSPMQRIREAVAPLVKAVLAIVFVAGAYALYAALLMFIWDVIATSMGWRQLPFAAAYGFIVLCYFIKGLIKPTA